MVWAPGAARRWAPPAAHAPQGTWRGRARLAKLGGKKNRVLYDVLYDVLYVAYRTKTYCNNTLTYSYWPTLVLGFRVYRRRSSRPAGEPFPSRASLTSPASGSRSTSASSTSSVAAAASAALRSELIGTMA
eukprot:7677857-Pyramimonas_sp.AAC.1